MRKTGRRRLQICAESRLARQTDMLTQLKESGYIVETESCLDQCTRCECCAFALVCGRLETARTPEELLAKLL
ncbi:MAG TPA: DUF1450 domain-containing protein [Symbiobacteriaceae bacterium]|nr:DUF1450 domain-containing protein [Symbiobacteriaceae bacterium]